MTDDRPVPPSPSSSSPSPASGAPEPAPAVDPSPSSSGRVDSPYAALRRGKADEKERPAERAGFLRRLVSDLPIKALAILVAVLLWSSVRGRILVETTVRVPVEFVAPERAPVRIAGGPRRGQVELTLQGTRAEVERAKNELNATAEPARFRFTVPEGALTGRIGPVVAPSQLQFPVDGVASLVTKLGAELEGTWYRVVEKTLRVVPPRVDVAPDVPAWVEVEAAEIHAADREIVVIGPEAHLLGPASPTEIRADPVDISNYLRSDPDQQTPYGFTVGFVQWRSANPLRSGDLLEIRPETVRGKVPLRPRAAREIEGRLATVRLPEHDGWEVTIRPSKMYDPVTGLARVELRGDPKALEMLKDPARRADWAYAIPLPPPPSAGDEDPERSFEAEAFLWFKPGLSPAVRLAKSVSFFVSLKKRAP